MSDDAMYRAEFLRRSHNLKHVGRADGEMIEAVNPLCGDTQEIDIVFAGDKIESIKFRPKGCLVSKVATDLVIDAMLNKTKSEAAKTTLEDIEEVMGMKLTPSRRKCANLGLESLQNNLYAQ